MAGMFGNLKKEGLEKSTDRLGGGFELWKTDIYSGVIKVAFAGVYDSGARYITVIFEKDGKEYKENLLITNKDGENFFVNDGGKKVPLGGFTIVDDLCVIITGKSLSEQTEEDGDIEEKVVKIYDFDQRKEVPKSVPVLVGLTGAEISLAIEEQLKNVEKKNESTGKYENTGEEKNENAIIKVFHTETKLTVVEAENEMTAGEFWDLWLEKNKGNIRDRRKNKGGGKPETGPKNGRPVASGAPKASESGEAEPPKKKLFGK